MITIRIKTENNNQNKKPIDMTTYSMEVPEVSLQQTLEIKSILAGQSAIVNPPKPTEDNTEFIKINERFIH